MVQHFTKLLHENEVEKGRKGLLLIALAMAGLFHASCRVEQTAIRLIRMLRGFSQNLPIGGSRGGELFGSIVIFDDFQTAASDMSYGLAWGSWP